MNSQEPLVGINKFPNVDVRSWTEKVAVGVAPASQGNSYVSGGNLGGGLAGIQRLMDEFSIESEDSKGTTVEVLKWV